MVLWWAGGVKTILGDLRSEGFSAGQKCIKHLWRRLTKSFHTHFLSYDLYNPIIKKNSAPPLPFSLKKGSQILEMSVDASELEVFVDNNLGVAKTL